MESHPNNFDQTLSSFSQYKSLNRDMQTQINKRMKSLRSSAYTWVVFDEFVEQLDHVCNFQVHVAVLNF